MVAAGHPLSFVTNAEVLQELVHRYLAIRLWALGREVVKSFAEVMQDRIEPVYAEDVIAASGLADHHVGASARNLVHAAVMNRIGSNRIVSSDTDFDRLPGIIRLDPSKVAEWEQSVLGDDGW